MFHVPVFLSVTSPANLCPYGDRPRSIDAQKKFWPHKPFSAALHLANWIATKYSCATLTINGGIQMRLLFFVMSLVFAGNAVAQEKPNMLIIWGDDIGFWNLSTNNMGMM